MKKQSNQPNGSQFQDMHKMSPRQAKITGGLIAFVLSLSVAYQQCEAVKQEIEAPVEPEVIQLPDEHITVPVPEKVEPDVVN